MVAVNWTDAKSRVLKSYREWIRAVRLLYICGKDEGMADVQSAERLMGVDAGSGNPNDVLARYASFTIEDEDAVGVWEA